jgi:hypothetical protein
MQTTVLGTRLTDAERAQVASAARRLKLSLSQFARQALLASSAQVEQKVQPRSERAEVPKRESPGMVLLDTRESHHFVDGICMRCGADSDYRDAPCAP